MATGGGKKKNDRKTKAFYDWAFLRLPQSILSSASFLLFNFYNEVNKII